MRERIAADEPPERVRTKPAPAPALRAVQAPDSLWGALARPRDARAGNTEEREARRVADAVVGDAAEAGGERPARDVSPGAGAGAGSVPELGGGEPMPAAERARFEARFGFDFSQVRIHHDARADRAAEPIGASAFTLGSHIAFRSGSYDPRSEAGRRLLAHELTHVVQQRGGGTSPAAGPIGAAPVGVARSGPPETRASVHQRMLKGMIELVGRFPSDDEARQEALVGLLGTVPEEQVAGLYHRLEPGAPKDDFALYFKQKFAFSRAEGLTYLRNRMPAPAKATTGSKSSPEVPGKEIGKEIAAAGCSVPSESSGAPAIGFGNSMAGEGYTMNPKYWNVDYILVKNDKRRTFTATAAKSGWKQTAEFLEKNKDWDGSVLDVRMGVGKYGAAAAIEDVYNPLSASTYSVDCLAMATLVQMRGIHMSYPEASRDADFDRDYGSFAMDRFGDSSKLPTSSLDKDLDVTTLDAPVALKDYAKVGLQPGDQVPISNPFITSGAWMTENTVYVGDGKFFGHPFPVMTVDEYAKKLAAKLDPAKSLEERQKYVLEHSQIRSYSRPRTRAARK
ncbi:MAG: DUF4157 domain-containing protein [Longimicrobiaceae bacterium]